MSELLSFSSTKISSEVFSMGHVHPGMKNFQLTVLAHKVTYKARKKWPEINETFDIRIHFLSFLFCFQIKLGK